MSTADSTRSRAVSGEMACATWLASGDGYCWDIPDWCELTGLNAEQAEGDGWADALHPEDKDKTLAEWADALANPRPYSVIYRARFADGEYRWINARALPVLRANGDVQNWHGLCFDLGPCRRSQTEAALATIDDIAARHLRAARAMLGVSIVELAAASKISSSTIRRIEADDTPVRTRRSVLERLVATYLAHGIVFYERMGTVSVGDCGSRSEQLPEWA
jgi:PAS domain S-box-containing protein